MYRRILTPLVAIGVTLAAAAPAAMASETGSMTISNANQSGERCTIDVQGWWSNVYDGVGFQVNRDGKFVVERLFRKVGQTWSGQHGETVDVGAWGSGTHVIHGTLLSANGKMRKTPELTVDCTTAPPKIIYVDRPGPVQTIEKTNTIYITQPAPPRKAECVAYRKTLNVMVGLKNGHENGPKMTRVDVWVNNVLVRRTGSRKAETKRIPLVLPCGTHKIRVTASIVYRGRHFTKTKRARVAGTGLGVLPVMLARL